MSGIGRGLLLATFSTIGLIAGIAGFLVLGLRGVAPRALPPAAVAQDWEITLELTDAFLLAQIDASGESARYALRDLRVTSRDGGTVLINVSVQADRPGLPVPLPIGPRGGTTAIPGEFVLRPGVRDGRLVVDVERASLGPLPLPANLGQLLETPINRQVTNAMLDRPFRIVDVATQPGAVIVRAAREGR